VVSGVPGVIGSLQVQLTLSPRGPEPMFNGDLFITLSHESGYSVLLNRVGRREGSATGYADNGFTFTLADTAAADVHTYRQTVTGNELTPISSATPAAPLTGSWQPDGRTADPGTVLTSSPRITSLGAFTGLDPNGEWTLFVADLGAGGLAQLESWSLEFTVVPEPNETAAAMAAALAAVALARRRQRKGG
jgi:MYXO-CTERM domain-containing protein